MRLLVVFISMFYINFSWGGNNDSLIKFSDLHFKSPVERSAFVNYQANSKNHLNLFLSSYNKATTVSADKVQQRIDDCANVLIKETDAMTEPKKIKFIYKYVHQEFLKMYSLHNNFSDIFEKGEYNCVSGSALYALIFEKLGIPYQIIEIPAHVYLVAYPLTHKIRIETTDPKHGYVQFGNSYIESYVKYLLESKIISQNEMDTSTISKVFNRHYFAASGVSIKALAGIQYSNFYLYDYEENNHEEGFSEIKKAFFLNPDERTRYLLKSALAYCVTNNDYSDKKTVDALALLCRYHNSNEKEITSESIKHEFLRLKENQLIKNSNYLMFDSSFTNITHTLKDTSLIKEISFYYHYELARLGYNTYKDKEYEVSHLSAAYKSNPKHADLQNLIIGYFAKLIDYNSEPGNIIKLMDQFTTAYPFLNNHTKFNSTKANCLLELGYQSFTTNNLIKGEKFLSDFELLCSKNTELEPTAQFVEKAYSVAAGIYYKKGNYAKAKQFLKSGLKYAPESFGLKLRLSQF